MYQAAFYGLIGEFGTSAQAAAVARELREAGFVRWDVYGPAPLEDIEERHAYPAGRRHHRRHVRGGSRRRLLGLFPSSTGMP